MTQLESFARRGFDRILEERGINDDVLLERLIEHGWAIRQFQVNAPADQPRWMHPAIQMVKRITKQRVPAAAIESVIAIVGDNPDEREYERAFADWSFKNPDKLGNLTWLKWARPNWKPKASPARADPFASLMAAGLMGD